MNMTRFLLTLLLTLALSVPAHGAPPAPGKSPEFEAALKGLVDEDREVMLTAIETLGRLGDVAALPALQALMDDTLRIGPEGHPVIAGPAGAVDALTGAPFPGAVDALDSPSVNNKVRRTLEPVVASLSLASPDPEVRLKAADILLSGADPELARSWSRPWSGRRTPGWPAKLALALALSSLDSPERPGRFRRSRPWPFRDQEQLVKVLPPSWKRTRAARSRSPTPGCGARRTRRA